MKLEELNQNRSKIISILRRHKTVTLGDQRYDGIQFTLDDVAEMLNGQETRYVGIVRGVESGYTLYDYWMCYACGIVFQDYEERPTYNFCPECGRRFAEEIVEYHQDEFPQ